MALVITQGEMQHKGGTFQSQESIAQSTATIPRVLDNHVDVSFLGVGTASGLNATNKFELLATSTQAGVIGDAVEGMMKWVGVTATGFAGLFVEMPTQGRLPIGAAFQTNFAVIATTTASSGFERLAASATAIWAFQSDGDFMMLQFRNGRWNYMDGAGATMHDAT